MQAQTVKHFMRDVLITIHGPVKQQSVSPAGPGEDKTMTMINGCDRHREKNKVLLSLFLEKIFHIVPQKQPEGSCIREVGSCEGGQVTETNNISMKALNSPIRYCNVQLGNDHSRIAAESY